MFKYGMTSDPLRLLLHCGAKEATLRSSGEALKSKYLDELKDLSEDPEYLRWLPKKWNQMKNWDFSNNQRVLILSHIALAVSKHHDHPLGPPARNYILNHIETWLDKAIPALPTFDHTALANSLGSFRLLGIYPGDVFMAAWTERALSPHILWNERDSHRISTANRILTLDLPKEILQKPRQPIAPSAAFQLG
jgi:hypothetical protein